MPDEFVIRKDDTESEIRRTLYDDAGNAVNLTTATNVTFIMRTRDGATTKVSQTATIENPALGVVVYQWQAVDTDTVGLYVAEWKVTWSGGGIQTFPNDEFLLVRVTSKSLTPANTDYLTLEDVKQTLSLQTQGYGDQDLALAISAASRAVDRLTCRTFGPASSATARVYSPRSQQYLFVDDFYEPPSVVVAWSGTTKAVGTDFLLHPSYPNAGWPYEALRAYKARWPMDLQAVTVTAKWGWPTIPDDVKEATKILVARLFRRPREAAFGIASLGLDQGAGYVARTDPDVEMLLRPYRKLRVAA